MILQELAELFKKKEYFWKLDNGMEILPSEDDFERVLDKAAEELYDEPTGTRLNYGRLIIEKRDRTHDVYVYTGSYQ